MVTISTTDQNVLLQIQPSGFCYALSLAWLLHCTKMNQKMEIKVERDRFCTEEHFYQNSQFYTNIMQVQQKLTLLLVCWNYLSQQMNAGQRPTDFDSDIKTILTDLIPRYTAESDAVKRMQIELEAMSSFAFRQMSTAKAPDCSFHVTHYPSCTDKSFWQAVNAMHSGDGMLITLYNKDFSKGHTIAFSKFADVIWAYNPNWGCTHGMADDYEESDYLTDICKECGLGEPCHLFCTKIKLT